MGSTGETLEIIRKFLVLKTVRKRQDHYSLVVSGYFYIFGLVIQIFDLSNLQRTKGVHFEEDFKQPVGTSKFIF